MLREGMNEEIRPGKVPVAGRNADGVARGVSDNLPEARDHCERGLGVVEQSVLEHVPVSSLPRGE